MENYQFNRQYAEMNHKRAVYIKFHQIVQCLLCVIFDCAFCLYLSTMQPRHVVRPNGLIWSFFSEFTYLSVNLNHKNNYNISAFNLKACVAVWLSFVVVNCVNVISSFITKVLHALTEHTVCILFCILSMYKYIEEKLPSATTALQIIHHHVQKGLLIT